MRWNKVALASTLFVLVTTAAAEPNDQLQHWLAHHAVSIQSIDAADENFSDLEPLIDAIGAAQVVQLGEHSHGAGGSFAAKVRLIKFLHARMGFDVLVWESGMHGMQAAQAGLRAGDDPVAAAKRGIFTIWSDAEQVKPVLEYVQASQSTPRPLEMTGMDMQFTAKQAFERFDTDLRAFVSSVKNALVRRRSQELAEQALAAYKRMCCARNEARESKRAELTATGKAGDDLQAALAAWDQNEGRRLLPTAQDLKLVDDAADGLRKMLAEHRASFEQAHSPRAISFMEHAIENLRGYAAGKLDVDHEARGTVAAKLRNQTLYFNRREELNARNLRWLIETGYPGRKFIVWAANAHIVNAYFDPEFNAVHLEPRPGALKPTGVYLAEWLADRVYTIAFTTYEGLDGWATTDLVTSVPPAAADSLESRLHALGKPYLFLDFRALDREPNHPLRRPQTLRILAPPPRGTVPTGQGNYLISDPTRAFDAVFYIDRMEPATRIGISPATAPREPSPRQLD